MLQVNSEVGFTKLIDLTSALLTIQLTNPCYAIYAGGQTTHKVGQTHSFHQPCGHDNHWYHNCLCCQGYYIHSVSFDWKQSSGQDCTQWGERGEEGCCHSQDHFCWWVFSVEQLLNSTVVTGFFFVCVMSFTQYKWHFFFRVFDFWNFCLEEDEETVNAVGVSCLVDLSQTWCWHLLLSICSFLMKTEDHS